MEFKMKRINFSSKNSRNRYALFLSKDEMSKERNKMSTIQSKDENCVRRPNPQAWAPNSYPGSAPLLAVSHWGGDGAGGNCQNHSDVIFSFVLFCPSIKWE